MRSGLALALAGVLLAGCGAAVKREPAPPAQRGSAGLPSSPSTTPTVAQRRGGAYYQDDGPGENPPANLEATPDAVPTAEPPLKSASNRPYVVFGKTYTPQTGATAFRQRGVGSWYGRKFHGQKTSSGEPYNMYAMTAAHPTLPLPSFVRVTNLANGRSVVVKVNDRGPFHSERIIDLSYTAALKLGYANQGSATVEIEQVRAGEEGAQPTLVAQAEQPATSRAAAQPSTSRAAAQAPVAATPVVLPTSTQADGVYLQLGAFGAREGAEEFRVKTYQQLPWLTESMFIVDRDRLHRIQLGPYKDRSAAQAVADRIRDSLQLVPMFVLK